MTRSQHVARWKWLQIEGLRKRRFPIWIRSPVSESMKSASTPFSTTLLNGLDKNSEGLPHCRHTFDKLLLAQRYGIANRQLVVFGNHLDVLFRDPPACVNARVPLMKHSPQRQEFLRFQAIEDAYTRVLFKELPRWRLPGCGWIDRF